MRVTDLQRLYDYSCWANRKLFLALARLTPEEFTQAVAGSYGSIRNTLVHMLSAEWGWLERCGGAKRGERLKAENYPTFESIATTWDRVEMSVREFLAGLTDDDLAREIEFGFGAGPRQSLPLGDLMLHAVIHDVHHRGQVALLLRTLGHVPGDFDLLYYAAEQRSPSAR